MTASHSSGAVDARALVRRTRDGEALTPGDIEALIGAYTRGEVPDYQIAAWLMAVFFRGLDAVQTAALTRAMLHSGRVLRFDDLPGPTVDKHSTGGVGDKISLPLAPVVAACGGYVPMLSGRGLGHTGGTLDKLESIPGMRTQLAPEVFLAQVKRLGLAFGGQTPELAPADGKLYALRDVTATVECIPLIVSSILSKKFASGTTRVVFDVKTGRGAFMREPERSRALAVALLEGTRALGFEGRALITDMEQPLGRLVGNALEVSESIELLQGGGPEDSRQILLALAGEMLALAGLVETPDEGSARAEAAITSGAARERFASVVEAQGGDPRVATDPSRLPRAPLRIEVPATRSGVVRALDAFGIGEAVVRLGGGRQRKEDAIDPAVGVELHKKRGDPVRAGETLAIVHARTQDPAATAAVAACYDIGDEPPAPRSLVWERLS